MALTADESRRGKAVIDTKTGMLKVVQVSTALAGATPVGGFLRDADGRLVVQRLAAGDPGVRIA